MIRSQTLTVMECDRCGFKETCDEVHHQDHHWGTVRAQTIGGDPITPGSYGVHLCVTCVASFKKWWAAK